ncbi:hypothetical protein U9M48_043411 [Paspalum notatum var. saurae]|uniref:Uncharacterized protein n=1 Tax=Paspalum notatum var. saurae TaxID=547442 RepID=A0AAQ3UUM1_PASNO
MPSRLRHHPAAELVVPPPRTARAARPRRPGRGTSTRPCTVGSSCYDRVLAGEYKASSTIGNRKRKCCIDLDRASAKRGICERKIYIDFLDPLLALHLFRHEFVPQLFQQGLFVN